MMELSEIIENAVAQAVADREAEQQLSTAPPDQLIIMSPEPVTTTSPETDLISSQPHQDLSTLATTLAPQGVTQAPKVARPNSNQGLSKPTASQGLLTPETTPPASVQEVSADAAVETLAVEAEEPTAEDSRPAKSLCQFRALARRSYAASSPPERSLDRGVYNPLDFYADVRFIPVMVSRGVFQILQLNPALRDPRIQQSYALISHGAFSHTWSLLPQTGSTVSQSTIIRPVAELQTYGKGIPLADAVIRDYEYAWRAQSVHIRHYADSWAVSGTHTAFQVCKDYFFEWKPVEFPRGSGTYELYLWRHNIEEGSISPAARLCSNSPVKSPDDDSELWSLEIDIDKLAPHIAVLSAFSIKLPSAALHSWFAPRDKSILPPTPLVNFAFQDDGHVYQRLEKSYGDWEDSRIRHLQNSAAAPAGSGENNSTVQPVEIGKITQVRVFKREYVEQYGFPPEALDLLNAEATAYLEAVKSKFGIY